MGFITGAIIGATIIGGVAQANAQKNAAKKQANAIRDQEAEAKRRAQEQAGLRGAAADTGAKINLGTARRDAEAAAAEDQRGTSTRRNSKSLGGMAVSASRVGGL